MLNRDRVFSLQAAQQAHDDVYHRDIANLPTADRIKHMTLHFAKYVGYLADALTDNDVEKIERILVDAFIITLATANSLTQDLSVDVASTEVSDSSDHSAFRILADFAVIAGRMAKACESLDHLEAMPFRDVLQQANLAMFKRVVVEADRLNLDLRERYFERIRQVEGKSFHRRLARTKVT